MQELVAHVPLPLLLPCSLNVLIHVQDPSLSSSHSHFCRYLLWMVECRQSCQEVACYSMKDMLNRKHSLDAWSNGHVLENVTFWHIYMCYPLSTGQMKLPMHTMHTTGTMLAEPHFEKHKKVSEYWAQWHTCPNLARSGSNACMEMIPFTHIRLSAQEIVNVQAGHVQKCTYAFENVAHGKWCRYMKLKKNIFSWLWFFPPGFCIQVQKTCLICHIIILL